MVYVIWTDPALDDLRAIKDYISRHNLDAARRFCLELYNATDRLRLFPRSGQVVPEFGIEDLREVLYGDYRILYECKPGACYVKAVIHGSRDLQLQLDTSNWK